MTVLLKRTPLRSIAVLGVVVLLAHVLAMPLMHQSDQHSGNAALAIVCTAAGVRGVTLDVAPDGGGRQLSPVRCSLCCPGPGVAMAPGPMGFASLRLGLAEPAPYRPITATASNLWQYPASARGPPRPS